MIDPLFYIYIFSWAPSKFHSLSLFKVCDDAETKLTMTTERMTTMTMTMTMMAMFGSRCDALFRISPRGHSFLHSHVYEIHPENRLLCRSRCE